MKKFDRKTQISQSFSHTIMIKYLFLFLLMGSIHISCSDAVEDGVIEDISPYAGLWSGTFTGDRSGTIFMDIKPDGSVSSRTKTALVIFGVSSTFGSVSENGLLETTGTHLDGCDSCIGVDSGFGTINLETGTGRGSWTTEYEYRNETIRGTWTITKNN